MTVHVIATGGTISSHWDGTEWTDVTGQQLVDELGALPLDVEVHELASGPSSNLSTDDMVRIAHAVRDHLDAGATGVVVVHGTDTMELTAFATQLVLGTSASRRPVVFTGSMRVHSHASPDGPQNLRDAIAVAASDDAVGLPVLVCVERRLHAADRVRKVDASSVDAFDSAPFAPVGTVRDGTIELATRGGDDRRAAAGWRGPVALVTCHPGMTADAVPTDVAGVVVAGFGDLNVPQTMWGPILAATQAGLPVLLASQVFTPNAGDEELLELGIAGAGGLTPQKARLALMAALGTTADRREAFAFVHQYALRHHAGDRSTT